MQATGVGRDTAFGRIVCMVEEAETHKAPVQRFADRFSTFYLPAVLVMGLITYLLTRQVVNAVAMLVMSCACAVVIATPVVILASVATAARRGVLIKGGAALEQLARVDTIVMDKTGTLTLGKPLVSDVLALAGVTRTELLRAVASVESRSEMLALFAAVGLEVVIPPDAGDNSVTSRSPSCTLITRSGREGGDR